MNKREKEVIQSQLDKEKAVMKKLEVQYKRALSDIINKTKILQSDIDALQTVGEADDKTLSMVRSKVYQKQYQQALKQQITGVLDKLHSDEYSTIQGFLNGCYEDGFIGTMYALQGQGIPIIAPIDQSAVVKAVQLDSKVVEGYYKHLGVDFDNLKKVIPQEVSRGIASSLPYTDIARNLNNASKSGLYNAKRIARTEGHRIQQQSAEDARQAAKKKGADVVKQWDASLDSRTRDSHRRVDGEIRENDEKFSNGLMYAGDPNGGAAEVINCRCVTLTRAKWALDEEELETLKERAEYFGLDKTENFEDYKRKYLQSADKMAAAAENDNDWSKALPKDVSAEDKRNIKEYANDRGITIGDIDAFDGDPALLKKELDTIDRTCKEYGIKSAITVSAKVLEDDRDFALTDHATSTITFNSKALRNREVTESNIVKGNFFASKTLEDIGLHETLHIFAEENKLNGLEISRKAYYNVFGKHVSAKVVNRLLVNEVSPNAAAKRAEIIPEVIVANKYNPTKFIEEFLTLLGGVASQ